MARGSDLSRRSFLVAGASAMGALALAGTALAGEAPAKGGAPSGEADGAPAGGPGGMAQNLSVEDAKAAAAAEGRTFGYAGAGDWLGRPEDVTVARQVDDYDVVVLGGGHAGIQAALAAAEGGAKVALCEKNAVSLILGEDFAAWNARFNQKAGFPQYNLGEVINEFVTRSGGRASAEIVASYVNNSGATLDHMIECMSDVVNDDEARAGKIIVQAMYDAQVARDLTRDVDWASIAVGPADDTTEEGYLSGYQALYDALSSFYDNGNQVIDHEGYPKHPGTKTWATTVQFMGHFHGREGHGGVAASSILGTVEMACLAKAVQNGAQVFMGYKGYEILKDDQGAVTGVVVYDSDADQYVQFNCKAVVSCCGGFVQNADMCWALLNELMEKYERLGGLKEDFNGGGMAASADGSGIKALCWAGGFAEPSPRGHMHLGGGPTGPWGCNCHLWLDQDMRRFCNEGNITAAETACSRKTGAAYAVIGGDYLGHIATCGLEHTGPNFGRPEYLMDMMYDFETAPEGEFSVTGMTTAERMGSSIYKSSSLEGLAGLLGIQDVDGFVKAVEDYNELCRGCQDGTYSCDPQFGKDASAMVPIEGPYYYGFAGTLGASATTPSMVTLAGVETDGDLCVLDANQAPIPGLYAAGNDLGGRYGTGYSTPAAGNSIGMAATNGRVAGANAAAYAAK